MGTQRGDHNIVFFLKRVASLCIKYTIKGEQHDIMHLCAQSDQSSLSIKQIKQKTESFAVLRPPNEESDPTAMSKHILRDLGTLIYIIANILHKISQRTTKHTIRPV